MHQVDDDGTWIAPTLDPRTSWLQQMGLECSSSSGLVASSPSLAASSPRSLISPPLFESSSPKKRKPSSPLSLPPLANIVSWPELLNHHAALMEGKPTMTGRRFNKTALALLDACVRLAQKGIATSAATGQGSQRGQESGQEEWNTQKEALGDFREQLLNQKEQLGEDLVGRVVSYIQQGLPPLLTADEKRETLLKKSLAFIQELSPALSIKTAPVVKSYVARLFDSHMDDMFAQIQMPEMDVREKALIYRRMLSNFIDDDRCVSFAAINRQLLGKLEPRDVWFLTFFACVTTRRSRGDNLLQLGCVGKSSVGKSMLFESILLTTGHQILSSSTGGSSETGCGRFNLGSKNAVVFHDINIATLVGADVEKVKSLARTENCIAKIHSSVVTVAPVFVIYTSNERLFKHCIPAALSGTGLSVRRASQVEEWSASGKKKISDDNLEAIRARFLEMYCFRTPQQNPDDLEKCGTFERIHFILGTFDRAMTLMEKYNPSDFHSAHLYAYVLSALAKNLESMEDLMCSPATAAAAATTAADQTLFPPTDCPAQHRQRLEALQQKYKFV